MENILILTHIAAINECRKTDHYISFQENRHFTAKKVPEDDPVRGQDMHK
jgi:hypothetical protein